jgi:hypothetical protein
MIGGKEGLGARRRADRWWGDELYPGWLGWVDSQGDLKFMDLCRGWLGAVIRRILEAV